MENNHTKQEDEPREASRQEMFENIKAMAFKPYTAEDFTSNVATKQEEKEQYTITSGNVCPKCKELYKPKVSDTCEACRLDSTPKVATSEKECACKGNDCFDFHSAEHCCVINKCYKDSHSINVTPHESEDWEAEFNKLVWNDTKEDVQMVKDFIKQVESKTYQRGREEGSAKKGEAKRIFYMQGYEAGKAKLLSLAVQEIEKERRQLDARMDSDAFARDISFNSGLDKAKSIISGLMKK